MWHYIKYLFKVYFGLMIIVALYTILKKADLFVGDWWLYLTLSLYVGYCYLDYRLTDKED